MKKIEIKPFEKYLIKRIKKGVMNGKKLYYEIQDQGFQGSYTTLHRFLKAELYYLLGKVAFRKSIFKKNSLEINKKEYKKAVRFETEPGKQAQVDWGHFGNIFVNGRKEKLYCFVLILSYSRYLYIEFTTSQNQLTFQNCHKNAFNTLGIPQEILYDNLKTAVIKREKLPDGSKKIYFNPAFLDFAKHYKFKISASPPYWPRAKGKVEASVKYIRYNFFQGLILEKNFENLEKLNNLAQEWLQEVANERIHKTTFEKPINRYKNEKHALKKYRDFPDYSNSIFSYRFSTKDCLIEYKSNFYELPNNYGWIRFFVKEIYQSGIIDILFYHKNQLIVRYTLSQERGKIIALSESKFVLNSKQAHQELSRKFSKKKLQIKVQERSLSYYNQLIK